MSDTDRFAASNRAIHHHDEAGMKRLILSVNVTLDGYMAGPDGELDWHFDYWNPEMSAYADAQLQTVDTIVVGRTTYEGMAQYWPVE